MVGAGPGSGGLLRWLPKGRLSQVGLLRRNSGVGRLFAGWRGLGRFWLGMLVILTFAGGVIQMLGSDASVRRTAGAHPAVSVVAPAAPSAAASAAQPAKSRVAVPVGQSRAVPGPIADPDPALTEPSPGVLHAVLPRISPDGRAPMHEYAAGFDPSTRRARVGILVAGIGMNEADSAAAIRMLPAAVTLAITPYAANPARMLARARAAEHEYLLSIPMEPQGFPENDPDDRHALMTSLPPADNLTRLHWAMARFGGYVGVTSVLGQLRGERLSGVAEQFDPILDDIAARGLLYVDGRPGQPPLRQIWNRSVDLMIDEDPADEATLDQRLEALAKLAKDRGSALGLVTLPRPVTLDRVTAWTNTLLDRGLVLAPVSALVWPPATQESEK